MCIQKLLDLNFKLKIQESLQNNFEITINDWSQNLRINSIDIIRGKFFKNDWYFFYKISQNDIKQI